MTSTAEAHNINQAVVANILTANAAAIRLMVLALPLEIQRWKPAPDAWSVLEIVGHLQAIDEQAFAERIRLALAENGPAFFALDVVAIANERRDNDKDPPALLASFTRERDESSGLITGLRDVDLQRAGLHPALGPLTIGVLLDKWIAHDFEHLAQISANVRSCLAESAHQRGAD